MQTITWTTFGVSNAVAKTIVHFFPSAGNVSAPYPANCKMTLFKEGQVGKEVMLEGPRLSQPDGVRLDAAFPNLEEGVGGFVGLHVSLTTVQPRINLSSSSCIIELASRAYSARFIPLCMNYYDAASEVKRTATAVRDSYNMSSIIVVNGSANEIKPQFAIYGTDDGGAFKELTLANQVIGPYAVSEVEIGEQLFEGFSSKQCSWGLLRINNIALMEPLPTDTACFMMYRDAVSKVPVSVCTI